MPEAPPPTIFERSVAGRRAGRLPGLDVPEAALDSLIPPELLRAEPPGLPEVSEPELVRHFTALSRRNFGVDNGFYPLGSCTMKHNPRINERAAALPGFRGLHPLQRPERAQGALRLMHELGSWLGEIAGLDAATLQPAAGAQGELTGLLLARAYHEERGEGARRTRVLIPDSAHGTNPASVTMAGYETVKVKGGEDGGVDLEDLRAKLDESVVCLMLTNPSTLGLFERDIVEIARLVHEVGGLLYYDGANLNAVMGISRPGDMGFDIVHFNLHKSFSTPHGGGGPGSGPVAVRAELEPYLPRPVVARDGDRYLLDDDRPRSIGKVRSFYGNVGMAVRAYAYIRTHGADGLREVSETAVLNANYLLARLRTLFTVPFDRLCMHECVLSARDLKRRTGVRALDVAKRLLDFGVHPPTVYFPLVVDEAIMIEPTETETLDTLDTFVAAMAQVVAEAEEDPERVTQAPWTTPVRRLDDARAVKRPVLRQPAGEAVGVGA
ncbi:MAG: glycine dehydrogenase subunit 2 [Miltoncostaeaceae bacterium]|jgi:glycine dehydrogenase subunit 2|nr:glycine dehydrogenase subunit 2 [Miltoncostaeaceae bacterium]